jgi:hypothetical protein
MSNLSALQVVFAVVLGLFALTAIGAGVWASFRSTDQDARIKRLQSERDDLLSRINYIEPKLLTLEKQNQVLLDLHNPAEQIAALRKQEKENHEKTYALLEEQSRTLRQIDAHLLGRESP